MLGRLSQNLRPRVATTLAAILFIAGVALFGYQAQAHGAVTSDNKTVNGKLVEFERNTLSNIVAGEPMQYIVRLLKPGTGPINYNYGPIDFDSAFLRIRDDQQQTIAAGELLMDPTDPGSAKMNAVMPNPGQYTAEIVFHKAGQDLASAEFTYQVFPGASKTVPVSPLNKYLSLIAFAVGLAGGSGLAWGYHKIGNK
jgi:hypothetical protein